MGSIKLVAVFAFCLALVACSAPVEELVVTPSGEPSFYRSLAAHDAVVDVEAARSMISLYRRNNGLGDLTVDESLQGAAKAEVEAMARQGSLDKAARGSLAARLAAAGVKSSASVENVSAGYHTLAEAFSGWRQSPPHNARMLDPRVKKMGLATAYAPGVKYKVFWALILAN